MEFIKMHGLGNDFILTIREYWEEADLLQPYVMNICHRNFGVGADGLVVIGPDAEVDFFMRIFNPDGSEAEMCGNAIRCVAAFVFRENLTRKKVIAIKTQAGIRYPEFISPEQDHSGLVKVNMGKPITDPALIPVTSTNHIDILLRVRDKEFILNAISMGNPHAVIFVEDLENVAIDKWGPLIEVHSIFPAKTNVEFVEIISPSEVKMKVWERAAGVTQACGTGACAVVVAAALKGLIGRKALVHLPGGDLFIEWDIRTDEVYMTGPAREVFRGELSIEDFRN